MRAFIFFREKPTRVQLSMWKDRLIQMLRLMENSFTGTRGTLILEDSTGEEIIDRERVDEEGNPVYGKTKIDVIDVTKADGINVKVAINGMEIDQISEDELKGLKDIAKEGVTFNNIYKYANFRNVEGDVVWEAQDSEVQEFIDDFLDSGEKFI
jgi:hypothetical protein